MRTTMLSAELLGSMKRLGMNGGWTESLDRLGRAKLFDDAPRF